MRNLTWKVPTSIQGDILVRVMRPPWYTTNNLQILYGVLKSYPNSQGGDELKKPNPLLEIQNIIILPVTLNYAITPRQISTIANTCLKDLDFQFSSSPVLYLI
jgi:hypothetical protein